MAVGDTYKLGPGELTIGATAAPVDVSCLVNNATIAMSKDEGDSVTKLCGTVVPGAVTYTYALSGNVDLDLTDPAGLFAMSQDHAGEIQDFSFTPSTDAGTSATGQLVIDPLDFGGDETGVTMASDFEFSIVGEPVYVYGTGVVGDAAAASATHKSDAA